ncbi:MAG: DivIVA domain-containing protein [Actinomycetota bacterium]
MSPAELDVPHSSDHIRGMEFGTIRRRGYDPEQVRDYLERVATRVATLELELREARLHAAPPAQVDPEQSPADDPYERLAARFAEALRSSDEQAEKLLQDAREEAALTLLKATTEAGRIRVDAQSRADDARKQADEILQNAKEEAERVLSRLSARRDALVDQLQEMQSRLVGFALQLEAAIVGPSDGDEPRAASPEAGAHESDLPDTTFEELVATDAMGTESSATEPAKGSPTTEARAEDDPIDPHFEDLWGSRQTVARHTGDLTLGQKDKKED